MALHRTLLAPWAPDLPESVTRAELQTPRAGRALADDDIELLVAIGVVEPTPTDDVFQLAPAHLAIGIAFLELGLPIEAAHARAGSSPPHGRADRRGDDRGLPHPDLAAPARRPSSRRRT